MEVPGRNRRARPCRAPSCASLAGPACYYRTYCPRQKRGLRSRAPRTERKARAGVIAERAGDGRYFKAYFGRSLSVERRCCAARTPRRTKEYAPAASRRRPIRQNSGKRNAPREIRETLQRAAANDIGAAGAARLRLPTGCWRLACLSVPGSPRTALSDLL